MKTLSLGNLKRRVTGAVMLKQTSLLESVGATDRHYPGTKRAIVELLRMLSTIAEFRKVIWTGQVAIFPKLIGWVISHFATPERPPIGKCWQPSWMAPLEVIKPADLTGSSFFFNQAFQLDRGKFKGLRVIVICRSQVELYTHKLSCSLSFLDSSGWSDGFNPKLPGFLPCFPCNPLQPVPRMLAT